MRAQSLVVSTILQQFLTRAVKDKTGERKSSKGIRAYAGRPIGLAGRRLSRSAKVSLNTGIILDLISLLCVAEVDSWLRRARGCPRMPSATLSCCCGGRSKASRSVADAKPTHRSWGLCPSVRCNIVASISACHAANLGSIPTGRVGMLS